MGRERQNSVGKTFTHSPQTTTAEKSKLGPNLDPQGEREKPRVPPPGKLLSSPPVTLRLKNMAASAFRAHSFPIQVSLCDEEASLLACLHALESQKCQRQQNKKKAEEGCGGEKRWGVFWSPYL